MFGLHTKDLARVPPPSLQCPAAHARLFRSLTSSDTGLFLVESSARAPSLLAKKRIGDAGVPEPRAEGEPAP